MGAPKKKLSPVERILKLVDELTPKQKAEVKRRLDIEDRGKRWDRLVKSVRKHNEGLPPISEEEVAAELTTFRREQRAKRAQSSS